MSVKTYTIARSFQENLRNPEKSFDFQQELEKFGGRRVLKQDAKSGVFYNIQTFCSEETATLGLKKGNNRRGLWVCPQSQIKKFINKMEKLSQEGKVPDRTIAWKQPHQIERDDKSSPLWFDFDVKDTNRIKIPPKQFLGCNPQKKFRHKLEPVKFYVSGEEISYDEIGEVMGNIIIKIINKKFDNTKDLFYYIYHDEIKYNNGFWIYFNKNFHYPDKKEIYNHFHDWCRKKLKVEGLKNPDNFWKDIAPIKNSFVAPLIPKQNRAFKIIFKSNDPSFNNNIKEITESLYDNEEEIENDDELRAEIFKYNKKMERKLFHHQNSLDTLGDYHYPPEINTESEEVGSIKNIKNAEFLHRINRLRNQYPELDAVLDGAENSVSESVYKGKKVWNILIKANKCVCPIHNTTHHRSVGWINIYQGSISNKANYFCVKNNAIKYYEDKELKHKLGKPKPSEVINVEADWEGLYHDFKQSGFELDLSLLGEIVKSFYPDIKYVEYNSAGKECYYIWQEHNGIWKALQDKKNHKIHTIIRRWWRDFAVKDLKTMAVDIHNLDDKDEWAKFGKFKNKIKKQLQTKTHINAILDSFSIESGLETENDFSLLLDHKRHLMPFNNGTIDWGYKDRKGNYHRPEKPFRCIEKDDYISVYIDKSYYGKYNKPTKYPITIGIDTFENEEEYIKEYDFLWNKLDRLFQTTILSPVMREYVKTQIGYGQTGYTHFKTFMGLIGHLANNGKSSLCGVLKSQLYPFCERLNERVFTDEDLHPTYLNDFRRCVRMGYIEEIKDGKKINAQRVKEWVGLLNEIAKSRILYNQEQGDFNFFTKFWICSNFDIPLDKKDNGLKDRLRAVEFNTRYVKAKEWERKLEQAKKKGFEDPEKYWNERGYYPEDSRFTQVFKESELMASVFQDYFYTRSVQAVQVKDIEEPEEMRVLREQICEKTDQIASFINDSIAQGKYNPDKLKESDWIDKERFFKLFRRWLSKTQSGLRDGLVNPQKFNHYIKSYISGNELYPDILHKRNGGKNITIDGEKTLVRNIVYGLKWIHKEVHTDEDGTIRGGWNMKKSYREKQEEKKRQMWEQVKIKKDTYEWNNEYSDDGSDYEEEEPVKAIKIKRPVKKTHQNTLKKLNKTKIGECKTCGTDLVEGDGRTKYCWNTKWFCDKHNAEYNIYRDNHKKGEDSDSEEEYCSSSGEEIDMGDYYID